MTTIDSLSPGAEATILEVGGARAFRRRLMEMGLLPGTRVRLVRRSSVHDFVELEVRSSHVTLRSQDAHSLSITTA